MGVADRLYRSRDDRMLAGVAAGVAEALDADPSIIRIAWALLTVFTGGIALVVYIVMAIVVPEDPGEFGRQGPWGPVAGPPTSTPPGAGPAAPEGAPAAPGAATEPWPASTPQGGAPFATGAPSPPDPSMPSPSAPMPIGAPPTYWADDRETRRAARRARRASGQPGRGGLVAGAILVVIGAFFLVREFVPWFDWNLWWPIGLIGLGALLLVVALMPGRPTD
jgi:phage shock protein PspC (stress-responsive transcriptional regulator)